MVDLPAPTGPLMTTTRRAPLMPPAMVSSAISVPHAAQPGCTMREPSRTGGMSSRIRVWWARTSAPH